MPRIKDCLYQETTHRGQIRFRFNRGRNHPRITIKGQPGQPEFESEYQRLLSGGDAHYVSPRRKKERQLLGEIETYSELVSEYYKQIDREQDRGQISESYRLFNERLLNRTLPIIGDALVASIEEHHIRFLLDETTSTTSGYNNMLKALRRLFKFAKSKGRLVTVNPAIEIEKIAHETKGFQEWTIDEVRQFLDAHPVGSMAHLTMCLLVFTAARRGDIVCFGPSNITNYDGQEFIEFQQRKVIKKDALPVYVPMSPYLKNVIENTITGEVTFLVNEYGDPFSAKAFGERFRKWVVAAGLTESLTMHGVRKMIGNELAEEGCSQFEIMATHGHSSPKVSEIYTRRVRRRKLAEQSSKKARWDEKLDLPQAASAK